MSERWIPLFAAIVGLLGGMGGAYIGGTVANEGQQQRFENEQKAETRNLRVDAYVDLLTACETAFYTAGNTSETERNRRVGNLRAAQARASLMTSSTEVRTAARELGPNGGGCGSIPPAQHISVQERFVEAAKAEVTGE
jgi:CHASE1-domain containing sensor protein